MNKEELMKIYHSESHLFNGDICIKCGVSISQARDKTLKCKKLDSIK